MVVVSLCRSCNEIDGCLRWGWQLHGIRSFLYIFDGAIGMKTRRNERLMAGPTPCGPISIGAARVEKKKI